MVTLLALAGIATIDEPSFDIKTPSIVLYVGCVASTIKAPRFVQLLNSPDEIVVREFGIYRLVIPSQLSNALYPIDVIPSGITTLPYP